VIPTCTYITLYTHTTYPAHPTRHSAPFHLVTRVRFARLHGALVASTFSESNRSTAVDAHSTTCKISQKYSREKTTCPGLRQRASTSLCVREQPPRTSLPLPRYNPPPLTSINTLRPNLSTNSRGTYPFCRAPDKTRPQHHNDAIGLNSEPHTFNTTRYPTVNEAKPPRELLN
jgi:hypothetical protein